ncbi:MAG: alpha/beta hydrolase-fold protein [Bacteroidales bacterium]|nr:alpha/beta hydrolase-fold protein [Bacteroidales bacterium]
MKNIHAFMHGRQLLLHLAAVLALIPFASAQGQPVETTQSNPKVTVAGTEIRTMHSEILNREMQIFILFPANYQSNPQKIYPCMYVTDANLMFALIANIAGVFSVPEVIEPQIFVVGIGYKVNVLAEWGGYRTGDLTPTNIPARDAYWSGVFSKMGGIKVEAKTGGAPQFLDFIEKELFSFMESNYRISPAGRGLGGYSYGGLFTLYAMLSRPGLFSIYYAGSPSISYDNGFLFTLEEKFAQDHQDLNAKLFMSAGGAEGATMTDNMNMMAEKLKSRNYSGLKLTTAVFPDENHMTCVPASVMRAFDVLYHQK